jgi:UDPglucose 6-dehydrogenase
MTTTSMDSRGPIGVLGLWHLGSVTAACLAQAGHQVLGVDPDAEVIAALTQGHAPVFEPGLDELLADNHARLRFSSDQQALAALHRAWVTFDTPVDEDDGADSEWVLAHAARLLAPLAEGALVIVSSQLPVGSVAVLAERCAALRGATNLRFACVPENLRLGHALECFRAPERIVVGVAAEEDRRELAELLAPFTPEPQWMRVESAEMTKHALNGFLATSVAFGNEIAAICETVGADATEVARGLKSERRIGPLAYLDPGEAFAGGTLARDVRFLRVLAKRNGLSAHVCAGVSDANTAHRDWTQHKLVELLGHSAHNGAVPDGARGGAVLREAHDGAVLAGRTVAIWGLTYKPGTDTLRRSSAVELACRLGEAGAEVRAHDPAVHELPPELAAEIELCATPLQALADADALVLCTAWPLYLEVPVTEILSTLAQPLVLDPAGRLAASMAERSDMRYVRVGSRGRS